MKKVRLFFRAFLEVLSFVLALATAFAFMVLGGSLFDVTGFLVFGLIELFFIGVWARFDELKRIES